MYKLKDYPDSFTSSKGKLWLKFKRNYKRKTNKRIRRTSVYKSVPYKEYNGYQIEW